MIKPSFYNIYPLFTDLAHQGKFDYIDLILECSINCEDIDLCLALLTASLPYKSKLPHRADLYDMAYWNYRDEDKKGTFEGLR